MIASTQAISPLRQRMLDDMRMRKLRPRTQTGHIRAVRYLAAFLQRSPDTATVGDLRRSLHCPQGSLHHDSVIAAAARR